MGEIHEYNPNRRILVIVGNYGSGKTEVAVNLAIRFSQHQPVAIADLDLVNPYFRCREARGDMEQHGIRVINPDGEHQSADLPIVLPEIKGVIQRDQGLLILDVGGDDVGARVLSSLATAFATTSYDMLQVINARRPFTENVSGCLTIKSEIEAASRLQVTGFISNTHLMDKTSQSTVLEGLDLVRSVCKETDLPLAFVTADESLRDEFSSARAQCPVLWIRRRMLPPWKLKSMTDKAQRVLGRASEGGPKSPPTVR